MSKTELYQELLDRMNFSMDKGFYMEACWIQYAIIEDRLNSTIRHSYPVNGEAYLKTLRGMDKKLEHIMKVIHPIKHDCLKTVHKELLKRITKWKDKRNNLMHDMTGSDDFTTVQTKVKKLAPEGKKLVNELSNKVRKYKELVKKSK